jgi:hypothetical protein
MAEIKRDIERKIQLFSEDRKALEDFNKEQEELKHRQ